MCVGVSVWLGWSGIRVAGWSTFKSAGVLVQSTTGSRGVRISGSNAGYTMFPGSVKSTCYPLHSPVSPSIPLPCVTVCHHISTGVYNPCLKPKWNSKKNAQISVLNILWCGISCVFNQILITVPVSEWVTITDQFEGHKFNWYKTSLMMALKNCRDM